MAPAGDYNDHWGTSRGPHTTIQTSLDMAFRSNYASISDYLTTGGSSPVQQAKEHPPPLTEFQAVEIFRNAVEAARELVHKQGQNEDIDAAVQPNLTLDLKRKGIEFLPEEVVNIIQRDVERIVLSHNYISHIPDTFSECVTMQYLNLRGNRFIEFPQPLLRMGKLQILDLSRNGIQELPDQLREMKSLRVLSVMHNQLRDLPLSLGSLESLRILKMTGNPLNEQLKTIINSGGSSTSPQTTPIAENEKDALLTLRIKQFLRSELSASESGGESSNESPVETPRPLKRNTSIRFPVVPTSGANEVMTDSRSPNFSKPPIPNRSHYRKASGHNANISNTGFRRPHVSPLTLGNERNRSNSENVLQTAQSSRNKRMGIVPRRTGLSPLEESSTNRNSLHLRGTSHGSALRDRNAQRPSPSGDTRSTLPLEYMQQSGTFIRRLSSVPEQKSNTALSNKTIEGAKGLLFSLHALHPYISSLLPLAADDGSKRSSLERVFYNSSTHLDSLDHEIRLYNVSDKSERQRKRSLRTICQACRSCIVAYIQVGKLLMKNAERILAKGDQRYVRMLLLLIYGSNIEATNAFNNLRSEDGSGRRLLPIQNTVALRQEVVPRLTLRAMTPTSDRPPTATTSRRLRGDTVSNNRYNHQVFAQGHNKSATHPQSAVPLYINGRSRSNSRSTPFNISATSSIANTPVSGESFLIPTSSLASGPELSGSGIHDSQDAIFEKIYLSLRKFAQEAQSALGIVSLLFERCHEAAQAKFDNRMNMELWSRLANRSRQTLQLCEVLSASLATLKLNDPEVRKSMEFWNKVTRFTNAFVNLCDEVKIATATNREQMAPLDTSRSLKPAHKCVRIFMQTLKDSPWAYVLANNAAQANVSSQQQGQAHLHTGSLLTGARTDGHHRTKNGSGSSSSPFMPTTPLSAALGPAAQATIPSLSSGSNSFDRSFQGDVFQRAEFALTMQHSAVLSRRG